MSIQQAISSLAAFRAEAEQVLMALRQIKGESMGLKTSGGFGAAGAAATAPASISSTGNIGAVDEAANILGDPFKGAQYGFLDTIGQPKEEDPIYRELTRRRKIAIAGQMNAMASLAMQQAVKGGLMESKDARFISGLGSNMISSVAAYFSATTLLKMYGPVGGFMGGIGLIMQVVSWADFITQMNEVDSPLNKSGNWSTGTVVQGSATYN